MISFGVIGASIKTGNVNLLSTLTVPEADRTAVLPGEAHDVHGLTLILECSPRPYPLVRITVSPAWTPLSSSVRS